VKVDAEDSVTGIDYIHLFLDNIPLGSSTETILLDTTLYSETLHNLWCIVYDGVRNCATSSCSITIDNTDPILQIIEPKERIFSPNDRITVSFSYTEKNPLFATITIGEIIEPIPLKSESDTVTRSIDLSMLCDGRYSLKIEVEDKAERRALFEMPIMVSSCFLFLEDGSRSITLKTEQSTITAILGTYTEPAYSVLKEAKTEDRIITTEGERYTLGFGVDIRLYNTDIEEIESPEILVSLSISYRPGDLKGISEETLRIYQYDGTVWRLIPSSVHTITTTVCGTTTHLSLFAIAGIGTDTAAKRPDSLLVYPNPFLPHRHRRIIFNTWPNSLIKIVTISGEEVARFYDRDGDGVYIWKNPSLASGVYIYLITKDSKKKTGKIGVVR
jgi:hypothetical protein